MRKREEKPWERRPRRKRRRMPVSGQTLGKLYRNAITKRTKGVTHDQDQDRKPT